MFSSLRPVLYVQISPEQLVVKNVRTGEQIADVPELAVSTGTVRKIVAVGAEARLSIAGQAVEIVNPFAHPRSLVSDYTLAELLLKHQVSRALGKSAFTIAPHIVVHPLGSPAGGFTQVERERFAKWQWAPAPQRQTSGRDAR